MPRREPETWPLPPSDEGAIEGAIEVVYCREDFLERLGNVGLNKANLAASKFDDDQAFKAEGEGDYFEPLVESTAQRTGKYNMPPQRHYLALFTINGYLSPERPSFLQTTMRVVSCLKPEQRMPVVACGEQLVRNDYERWVVNQRRGAARALGCYQFVTEFDGLMTSLFEIAAGAERKAMKFEPYVTSRKDPAGGFHGVSPGGGGGGGGDGGGGAAATP